MAKANDAYRRRDSHGLEDVLREYEGSPSSVSGSCTASEIERVRRQINQLRHRLGELDRECEAIRVSERYRFKQEVEAGAIDSDQRLTQLADQLDQRILAARAVLEARSADAPAYRPRHP